MICKECGHEMAQDIYYLNYWVCYHCGTQVSYSHGQVIWEIRKMKVM